MITIENNGGIKSKTSDQIIDEVAIFASLEKREELPVRDDLSMLDLNPDANNEDEFVDLLSNLNINDSPNKFSEDQILMDHDNTHNSTFVLN